MTTGELVKYIGPRIPEDGKKYYLSKSLLDPQHEILPNRPGPGRASDGQCGAVRPRKKNPAVDETLAKRIEAALRAIEQADATCSRVWASHFHCNQGRLEEVR
jgi:hypothetical protein